MNKLYIGLVCICFIYLINLASYPCPNCNCKEEVVTQVSVYATAPSLDQPVTKCSRARDIRGHWSVETFVACAEIAPDVDDVSILLQLTLDRSDVLIELADRWQGPMSVVIYCPRTTFHVLEVQKLHKSNDNLLNYADFHIVYEAEKYPYPANHLRNVALINARTDFVLTLDVDFIPNPSMHEQLKKEAATMSTTQKEIHIIAAFESDSLFPDTKRELKAKSKEVFQVHLYKGRHAHEPTDYTQWYKTNNRYQIQYQYSYEPYYVIRRSLCPLFDERFVGYGNDKSSHAYELAVAGFKFTVLPEVFIIHKNHPSPGWRSGQGSSTAWQLWMEFTRAMEFKHGSKVEVPEWLKDACNQGDCPQFWILF